MATEEYLLEEMVKGLPKEVHRQRFHSMVQNEGEFITYILSRLFGQAKFCEFDIKCPNEQICGQPVDYSEVMVAGQMIAGLANLEDQNRI